MIFLPLLFLILEEENTMNISGIIVLAIFSSFLVWGEVKAVVIGD